MNTFTSIPEKQKINNSLICLLKSLCGNVTTVELRDESNVTGKVANVDSAMNVSMERVTLQILHGTKHSLDMFYIRGRNIRYVHIPDEANKKALRELLPRHLGVDVKINYADLTVNIIAAIKAQLRGPKNRSGTSQIQKKENRYKIMSKAITSQQKSSAGPSTSQPS